MCKVASIRDVFIGWVVGDVHIGWVEGDGLAGTERI